MSEKIYSLIVEWKSDGPLILEGKPMDFDEAFRKMREMEKNQTLIRIAIFKMMHADGNGTLIPKEKEETA